MRLLLLFLILVNSFSALCQQEEIYKLTFSDTSNFNITNALGNKSPDFIFIANTTQRWSTERFWLEDFDLKLEKNLKNIKSDEHHSYHHTYLFNNPVLNKLIDDKEKIELRKRSSQLSTKKISLNGPSFATIKSLKKIKGFCVVTSEPIFTSDGNFAFIDLHILLIDKNKQNLRDTYFGTVCIVFQKQLDNTWKKIYKKEHLIL